MTAEYMVEFCGVEKRFAEVRALDGVSFRVQKGVIHGLLGENGAGKSSLMKILYGLYRPDRGSIHMKGAEIDIRSPYDSIAHGVGMVHQSSTLVDEFTAVENIVMGSAGPALSLPLAEHERRITQLAARFGMEFPLRVKVKELPAGLKQKIEIIRSLYHGAELLILDEPTTSLVEHEFEQLLASLKKLVAEGMTVIFITHKIKEVMAACHAVTVLRKGRVQGSLTEREMESEGLVKLMFTDQDIRVNESALPAVELPAGEFGTRPLLSLRGVSLPAGEESPGLRGIDLDLYPGEIFGIAAVSGNGERDLAGAIADPSRIAAGSIEFDGERVEGCTALEMFARGLAYTPEDRIREAVLPDGSISENVLLGHQGEERFLRKRLFIDWRKVRETAKELIERYHVQAPGPDVPMRTLSGGNMQKAVMGRAFVNPIKLLLTHNPTSGLDISTVEFIFAKLVELSRTRGGTVLWINEDLDELMIISDRIGVLSGGRLTRVRGRSEFDKYAIGREMIGGGEQV